MYLTHVVHSGHVDGEGAAIQRDQGDDLHLKRAAPVDQIDGDRQVARSTANGPNREIERRLRNIRKVPMYVRICTYLTLYHA